MLKPKINIVLLFFCFICTSWALAQTYIIEGTLKDKTTQEPIVYGDVFIKGTTIGTVTDDTGYYKLVLYQYYDSLTVAYLGYDELSYKIKNTQKQTINFELTISENVLFETVIYANRESIEDFLLRKIQEYKPKNNTRSLDNYQYQSYTKVEIDAKNISEKTQNRKILQQFSFIFDNIDSTSEEEPFLPLMIAENISQVYYSKEQNKLKEHILASKISGIEDNSLSEFLGATATQYNIYDNSYNIMEKEFISPIAPNGKLFYDYKVIDTIVLFNAMHYKMQFKPKGEGSNTFYGSLIVAENNFAIKSITLNMAKHVNINFIKRIILSQDYEYANNTFWMLSKDYIAVEFAPLEKKPAFIIRRNSYYRDFILNDATIENTIENIKEEVITDDELKKDNAYWDSTRFVPLSKNEATVYHMIDTIMGFKSIKTLTYFFNLVLDGYLEAGPVSFGPVFSAISYNKLEGVRFRGGMKTNSKLSENYILEGYFAYGLRDKEWKYGFKSQFLIDKLPRQTIAASYIKDISKIRRTTDFIASDNLLNTLFLRNRNIKLLLSEEAKFNYTIEWRKGYSHSITLQNRRIDPKLLSYNYINASNDRIDTNRLLNTSEIIINSRFAIGENFLSYNSLYRSSINSSSIPVINVEFVFGIKNIFKSQFTYQKITLLYKQTIPIRPIGRLDFKLQTGKVFGKVPYLLSEVHDGNQTYGNLDAAYNLMNDYEFYSDQYIAWILIHHFEGFFFNKIPGVRKLKLREYVDFRGVWGNVSMANRTANSLSDIKQIGKTPYLEIGFGLENVLKFFKFGGVCRLTHRDVDIQKWGFLFGLDFDF